MSNLLIIRANAARAFVTNGLPKGRAWAALAYAYDRKENGMLYLVWFDDSPKKTIEAKIADAVQAYQARYGASPNVALVSEADNAPASVGGVATRVEKRVSRNNIQVGHEG